MLKAIYESQEDIPESFRELYTDRDAKWELTGVEGIKTQADIDRVKKTESRERELRQKAEKALKAFGGKSPEEIASDLDELEELRAQKEEGSDSTLEQRVEKMAEMRIQRKLGPLQREHEKLKRTVSDVEGERDGLRSEIKKGRITTSLQAAAVKAGVIPEALPDVLLYGTSVFDEIEGEDGPRTRDSVGVTPGLTPEEFIKEAKANRPHWFPHSSGGGSKGSGDGGRTGVNTDKLSPREKLATGLTA